MEASSSRNSKKTAMNPSADNSSRKNSNDEEQGAISYFKSLIHSQQSKKDKNDRSRFLGEGVSYKAKLIGILEVSEARGDRMCQEALADLKMAIRAAGEHKQRININIAIDGLRLRDEKTGDCLYHHPVHKISFIAQDMTDSRAFGYIFGSPDTGHRFFGIKTDKAASQVVISMRDLFQVVFELKKKEIEMAKQHIEQHQMKFSSPFPLNSHLGTSNSANGSSSAQKASVEPIKMLSLSDDRRKEEPSNDLSQKKVVDLLLDLELELSNIHQGISQMIKITPCDPMGSTTSMKMDQFEDSFNSLTQKAKLPPPPDSIKRVKNENQWFDQETEVLFEETELPSTHPISSNMPDSTSKTSSVTSSTMASTSSAANNFASEELFTKRAESPKDSSFDVFTDLDPLGTGRSRPYVDKKDFFQDLKNPPKKLLKDLVNELPHEKSVAFKPSSSNTSESTSKQEVEPDPAFLVKPVASRTYSDPFQDDPFEKDPFVDEFTQDVSFKSYATDDPFEKFADFTSFDSKETNLTIAPSINKTKLVEEKHSPLKVSLPPEKISSGEPSMSSPLQSRKFNKLQKHNTISGTVTLPSPKQKARKVVSQVSVDVFADNIATTSSSQSSLNLEHISNDVSAPEPPPRVNLNTLAGKPPPLPPKKLISSTVSRPVPRPPNSDYDYIENYQSNAYSDFSGPPLPAPARKTKNGQKSSEPEYYLQPFPLLPPPKKKASPKTSESSDSVQSSTAYCPTKSLDITLSQLTKTGFSDLAASLNMSPSSLSKMTLQDLTKCLETLSNENQKKEKETSPLDVTSKAETQSTFAENPSSSSNYFSAEFEAHFGGSSSGNLPSAEESLFDKYAVFRELVEQEQQQALTSQDVCSDSGGNDDTVDDINEPFEDSRESIKETDKVIPSEDRYAALRDLCLDDIAQETEIDGSDKEDSIVEASRLDEDTDLFPSQLEEDTDLLPSHPHSESTESPTVTMKEHQSVMETTIMEEDVSALDGDDDDVPEETTDVIQAETESISNEKVPDNKSDISKKYEPVSILPEVDVLESKISTIPETSSNNAWAKFDSNVSVPDKSVETPNEGHVSPWSAESKENDLSPTLQEKKKYCRPRRRVVRDEDESDEHWNMRMEPRSWSPSWRENGWSDGDSLCDEVPPYVRDYHCDWRGCRRRVSPWNSRDQSPWDEDERELTEDQWEDCRWQGDPRQRQRYKGPSWEDERRRHYEEVRKSRKQMAWSSDIDRKSSRESLTWDDDDRYSKRSYVERRHRKWDDEVQGRHRRWRDRERVEPGKKMSVRYYRDRSHEHQWDDDYIEQSEVEQTHWPQRPRSCDRSRRQYGHHSGDDFSERRYPRTMTRDEYTSDIDYRRRAQTLQLQKSRRKHNVTSSPFEDDFNTHFGYSNEINFAGSSSDIFEGDIKASPLPLDSRKKYQFSECSKQKEYSQFGSPHTPGSVHSRDDEISLKSSNRCCQQSPFEDDFTSPEARRCSGRSVSSDLSDPKSGDDVFYAEPKEPYKMKCDNRRARVSNKSDPGTSSAWPCNKPVTPSTEYAQPDNCRKKATMSDREEPPEYSSQYNLEKKVNLSDYKPMMPSLKRSDSASSLKKSESINIFARNRDPFDDDFFCESTPKPSGHEKGKSNFVDPVKWNDAFNSFNFADEPK